MIRHVLLQLRQATADDFKTENQLPRWGVAFFKQSNTGTIERNVHYLNQENANTEFKELFEAGQIWVMQNANEAVATCEE